MPRNRFEVCYGVSRSVLLVKQKAMINGPQLSAAWSMVSINERRVQEIYPGWQLCIDESVSSWRGKDGDFCSDGMPHVTRIDRKPKGVGRVGDQELCRC